MKKWEKPELMAEFNLNSLVSDESLGDWGQWTNTWTNEWLETP